MSENQNFLGYDCFYWQKNKRNLADVDAVYMEVLQTDINLYWFLQRECQQWDMELKNLQQAQREEFKTYIRELANDTNNAEESSIR